MSDIRQLLRYEIPGYILFTYTFLLVLPFIAPSKIITLLPYLLEISISGLVVAIPIGWLLYQIYNELIIDEYYNIESIDRIKGWAKVKNLKLKDGKERTDVYYGELINVSQYLQNKNGKQLNLELANGTLRGYWEHFDARYIVGLFVPFISVFLAFIVGIFLQLVSNDVLLIDKNRIYISFSVLLFISSISLYIYKPTKRIREEINALQLFLIELKKKEIIDIIQESEITETIKKEGKQKEKEVNNSIDFDLSILVILFLGFIIFFISYLTYCGIICGFDLLFLAGTATGYVIFLIKYSS